MNEVLLFDPVSKLCDALVKEFDRIHLERKSLLESAADYIRDSRERRGVIQLNYICTHNSRRSHMGQVWAQVAAEVYQIPSVRTFSGGTEATACNPRTIAAFQRAGFQVAKPGEGDNPIYALRYAAAAEPLRLFSKVYSDPINPDRDFAAFMTCDSADAACPVVFGAEARFPTTYEDPKVMDDQPGESSHYTERLRQIGREALYMFSCV